METGGGAGEAGGGRCISNGHAPPRLARPHLRDDRTATATPLAQTRQRGEATSISQGEGDSGSRLAAVGWVKGVWERLVVPVLLMTSTPNVVILQWFCERHCGGSYSQMARTVWTDRSLIGGLAHIWSHVNAPSAPIVCILIGYTLFQLLLMRLLPGNTVYGPLTPKGNRPQYRDNGFACFLVTLLILAVVTAVSKAVFGVSPSLVYERFDEVLLCLNLFSLLFCLLLYIKGLLAPSSSDCGSSGNFIFDYFWGTELYPRLLGWDVKVFTNCRFGMTAWGVLVCLFALKSWELHGPVDSMLVSAALQMVYFLKFFWWEAGYMCTIDIMLDRAGYYICWGCLVFVPGMYASVSLYLVQHPVELGPGLAAGILTLGLAAIYVNYDADRQKLEVRRSQGACRVWGRPARLIRARYRLESGEERQSLLLASGWWGLARHFHYVPELLLSLMWALPALQNNLMPYSYVIYLAILLTHRSFRDETKCSVKYQQYWSMYKQAVPWRIVPYVF